MKYANLTQNISANLKVLHQQVPDVMKGFSALAKGAMTDGVLSEKSKELIAVAIAVATRCDGCIGFHVKTLVRLGVTLEELNEVLGVAVYMGGGPSLMYAANVIEAYQEFLDLQQA